MQADVKANMWAGTPRDVSGLAALYTFTADTTYTEPGGKVRASSGAPASKAPLSDVHGMRLVRCISPGLPTVSIPARQLYPF